MPAEERPGKAIFVTSRSTKQITQQKHKDWAHDTFGMELEIVDLGDLAFDLQSDLPYCPLRPDTRTDARFLQKLLAPRSLPWRRFTSEAGETRLNCSCAKARRL